MWEPTLLSRQAALVTGASSGIGRATAAALARVGAKVAVNHLPSDREAADELVEEIRDGGGTAVAIAADVSVEEQVQAMFNRAVEAFGTIHILVNNAGIQRDAAFTEMTLDQWRKVIDVNLTGQFLCAREALREFLRRGPQREVSKATGKIICISSVHERIPWAGHANYAASKGGVALMMQSIAQEFANRRIRVNSISPGAIRTAINETAWHTPAAMSELLELIPYGRIGETSDIADATVWLASDLSDYVTGTTIYVDGGMTLYPGFREGG